MRDFGVSPFREGPSDKRLSDGSRTKSDSSVPNGVTVVYGDVIAKGGQQHSTTGGPMKRKNDEILEKITVILNVGRLCTSGDGLRGRVYLGRYSSHVEVPLKLHLERRLWRKYTQRPIYWSIPTNNGVQGTEICHSRLSHTYLRLYIVIY